MNSYKSLSTYVTEENQDTIVGLMGLPFEAKEVDIIDFMKDFDIKNTDVVIGMKNGKSSGRALVFMKNEDQVLKAEESLDMKYIGSRYIKVKSARKWGDRLF